MDGIGRGGRGGGRVRGRGERGGSGRRGRGRGERGGGGGRGRGLGVRGGGGDGSGRGRNYQQYHTSNQQPRPYQPPPQEQHQPLHEQIPQQSRSSYRPSFLQVISHSPIAMSPGRSEQSSRSNVDSGLVPKIEAMKLTQGTSQSSSSAEAYKPIRRPDMGGRAMTEDVNVLVNHFSVKFEPQRKIWHYDIDVKPEEGRSEKISKARLNLAVERLFSKHTEFPSKMTAFDGGKIFFSAVQLPTGEFTVKLSDNERCPSYTFTVTEVKELELHKLKDYLSGELLQLNREVLQGMDVVMKEDPRRDMVSIGKSFHPKDSSGVDLLHGLELSEGFQHSLKPTSQGLVLCLDVSYLAVRQQISVLDYIKKDLDLTLTNMSNFEKNRKAIESALGGLKVRVTHRSTMQQYLVSGLTEKAANQITFDVADTDGHLPPTSTRLVDYFRKTYPSVVLEHEDWPCLSLGKGKRANYVPIELCILAEGQRYPRENLKSESAKIFKNSSVVEPEKRKTTICGFVSQNHGPCRGEISRNFGINVSMDMTCVKGRVLPPPTLKLKSQSGDSCMVNSKNCQWNFVRYSVVEGVSLKHWAVLDFSTGNARYYLNSFIDKLVERCQNLGMEMARPVLIETASLSSVASLTPMLRRVHEQARQNCEGNKLQLLLCVMSKKEVGYKYIKWVSEMDIGILTQCCLIRPDNMLHDQYLAQLGLKINAKLGGSNTELYNLLPAFNAGDHLMIIGADVNHPGPKDCVSPSISAVVASMNWPGANKYNSRINIQDSRVEEIMNFGRICLELVESYEKINRVKPGKLIIFRDGVSESQHDMVLNRELRDLKNVFGEVNYTPTITLVIARKRHQTRIFRETKKGAKVDNVPPGTVVDTEIVHPIEFDFYLCSHFGGMGTSKATHYFVLWDEHHLSSDELQNFIYQLCFTFARCSKAVSLVPPVYYADLLAYRGRMYYEVWFDPKSSVSASSTDLNAALSSMVLDGLYFI